MKAIVYEKYGSPDVLKIQDVAKPVPKDDEVLILCKASSVTRYDCWARSCKSHTGMRWMMRMWYGILKPKQPILGTELAGKVESVGSNVSNIKPGDKVFGYPGMKMGSYAEYVCLPEEKTVKIPQNTSYEEAGSILQSALTAWFFLKEANIKKGQKVLIIGASGGVGMYSVQLAKNYYKAEVTGICSENKADFVKSMGADKVIDYHKEDFTRNGEIYDVIFDTYGKSSFASSKSLTKMGVYLFATFGISQIIHIAWLNLFTRKKVKSPLLKEIREDLLRIKDLIETDHLKSVVDKVYPFHQVVEAHQYLEDGHKKGNIVLTFND